MRICLRCAGETIKADWCCTSCGFTPAVMDGFTCFAPDLALENDGMAATSHDALDRLQGESFWFRSRNRLIMDLIRRHVPGAMRVLEVGCGTGYVSTALLQALPQARLTASEIFTNGLGYAARRTGGLAELVQMDARAIPFRAEFDLICAFDVLEHIDADTEVLSQMVAALAPGGSVLLSVPQHPALWSQVDDIAHHKRRYTTGELAAKCRAAGLVVRRNTSFVSSLLPLMLLSRWRQRDREIRPEDELRLPRLLDRLLEQALGVERWAIGLGLSLPWGGSRFVLASLPAEPG